MSLIYKAVNAGLDQLDFTQWIDEATYSPEDNKLRIYPNYKDDKIWKFMKENGAKYAAKQGLIFFFHTIDAEDFLKWAIGNDKQIELEGTTLSERAEERAARFSGYYSNRVADSIGYAAAADRYSERFAFGQPILVGHHSQKSAERDRDRADNAMLKSIDNDKKASYWSYRIAGVEGYAKKKNSRSTRLNRMKRLFKEMRDHQRLLIQRNRSLIDAFQIMDIEDNTAFIERALCLFSIYSDEYKTAKTGPESAACVVDTYICKLMKSLETNDYFERSIKHILNRLSYEQSQLGEIVKYSPEKLTPAKLKKFLILHGFPASNKKISIKLDKATDKINVTLAAGEMTPIHFVDINLQQTRAGWCETMHDLGYEVPQDKPAPAPLLNIYTDKKIKVHARFRGIEEYRVMKMTKLEYKKQYNKYTIHSENLKYRFRCCPEPTEAGMLGSARRVIVFITDQKEHDIPSDLF